MAANFSLLLQTLQRVAEQPELSGSEESRLRLELERRRESFVNILHYPGPNPDERKALEEGVFRPPDQPPLRINAEFRAETFNVSKELKLSEYMSAQFLTSAFEERHRFGHSISDTAILLYFEERAQLLECLELILTSPNEIVSRFADEIMDSNAEGVNGKVVSWGDRALEQIEQLSQQAGLLECCR